MDISSRQAWKGFHGSLPFPTVSLSANKLNECSESVPRHLLPVQDGQGFLLRVTGAPTVFTHGQTHAARHPQTCLLCRLHVGLTLWLDVAA